MQARDLAFYGFVKSGQKESFNYSFKPTKRGAYHWKNIHVFLRSFLSLLERRVIIETPQSFLVYPSVLPMKNSEFLIFIQQVQQRQIKKIILLDHTIKIE